MQTTIDSLGRIVLPKPIRDRLQLTGGELLEIEEREGVVEIRLVPAEVRIVETPDGPVAEAIQEVRPLADDVVRDTVDRVRR